MTEKRSYGMLDVCKFCCGLLILLYHFFSEHGGLPGILNEALSLYAVAVALFMAISGFLVFDKTSTLATRKERWNVVAKQVKHILRVYLLWSIPYQVFQIASWDFSTISLSFVLNKVQGWVFGSTFYTIWFMPALCVGLLVAFAATEYLPKVAVNVLAAVAYVVGSLMLTYNFLGDAIPGSSAFTAFANRWLQGPRGGLFFGFPLLIVGKLVVEKKEKLNPIIMGLASVICMALVLAEALLIRRLAGRNTGIDMTMMMLPLVFCILGCIVNWPMRSGKGCVWMRKMSTLIFMSQRVFLTVLPAIIPAVQKAAQNQLAAFALMCGGTLALSWCIEYVSRKYQKLRALY